MTTLSVARSERTHLCDLMLELGPDAPTVPEGWDVIDLAAHLIAREYDLWAAPGIVLGGPFRAILEADMERRRRQGLPALVAKIRSGPPRLWRLLPPVAQLSEYYIHHEDIRRANDLEPRVGDRELDDALAALVPMAARRNLRSVPVGVDLVWQGGVLYRHGSGPRATVSGPPGELLLYLSGRGRVAQVEVEGPEDVRSVLSSVDLSI